MVLIRIPTPLRAYTDGHKEVTVEGVTIGDALEDLTSRYPSIHPHLFDSEGNLRPYVNIFINEDDTRNLSGFDTPVNGRDRVMILPSIAGGVTI